MMTRTLAAWLVHAFTASGAVLAYLSLEAIVRREWAVALGWMFLALAIDGVDGSLARWVRVKEILPRISGATLDLVIDYLNYVFVPTILIVHAGLLPAPLQLPLAAAIQLSSLYVFARGDMKTGDGYFRGFPALWNIVALYLLVLQLPPPAAAGVVLILVLLTFAPVLVVHPFRVRDFGPYLPLLTLVWAAATLALLLPGAPRFLVAVSLVTAAVLLALGMWRTIRGGMRENAEADHA